MHSNKTSNEQYCEIVSITSSFYLIAVTEQQHNFIDLFYVIGFEQDRYKEAFQRSVKSVIVAYITL